MEMRSGNLQTNHSSSNSVIGRAGRGGEIEKKKEREGEREKERGRVREREAGCTNICHYTLIARH